MAFAEIESRVAGIPCIIDVEEYEEGDWEWAVLDRRGRYAEWLERKLTSADRSRIDEEIAEYFRINCNSAWGE
jgi:uncharacterized protein YutD